MSPANRYPRVLASLEEAGETLRGFLADPSNVERVGEMGDIIAEAFAGGNKVLCCGNGGSACDAIHFAEECTGRFRSDRRALPAIPLTDSAHLTCVANDYGYDEVFARGVAAYGRPGDILLAISTSGNSKNVVRAVEEARRIGLKVLLLLGKDGGVLLGKGDAEIRVLSAVTERIQEVHMLCLHAVIESMERKLFPGNYPA